MKAYCILFLLLSWGNCWSQENSDSTGAKDSLVDYLAKVETEKYLEEPAGNFISLLEPAGIKTEIKPSNKLGYRYMAVIGFHEKPYLEVYLFFNQLKYVNPNGFSKRKKARLVKKEKLQEINVYNASLCVNGCDD